MEDQLPHQHEASGIPESSTCFLTAAVGVITFLLVLRWLLEHRRLRKATHPPGPSSFPLWGHWSLNSHDALDRKCKEWVKIYGPVFSIRLGTANVVILNDMASIKQFYCSNNEQSRPQKSIFYEVSRGTSGMFTLNGEAWVKHRHFSLRVLQNLGFGKTPMGEHIKEELLDLVNQIKGARERSLPVLEFLIPSLLSVTSALLFGTRFPIGNPKREYLAKLAEGYVEEVHCAPLIEFKPHWLSRLEAVLPFTRTGAMRRRRQVLIDFIRDQIKEHEDTIEEDGTRDFIDGYLKKVEEHQRDPNSAFRGQYLLGNTLELFFGSASNTPALIHWLLLVCAQNPISVQARIQKEVDDVVGRERQPTWEDRKAMPFTMASVLEITRWKVTMPIGMPRGVPKDTPVSGYIIPKGTMVVTNINAVHRNPALWGNADKFDPTRFLTADGAELLKKPEHHIAFSLGKRNCPAEKLSNVAMFLYMATLMQKFSVLPDEGVQLPDLGCLATSSSHTSVKKLRFVVRP